jgi:hypothetical protein
MKTGKKNVQDQKVTIPEDSKLVCLLTEIGTLQKLDKGTDKSFRNFTYERVV